MTPLAAGTVIVGAVASTMSVFAADRSLQVAPSSVDWATAIVCWPSGITGPSVLHSPRGPAANSNVRLPSTYTPILASGTAPAQVTAGRAWMVRPPDGLTSVGTAGGSA